MEAAEQAEAEAAAAAPRGRRATEAALAEADEEVDASSEEPSRPLAGGAEPDREPERRRARERRSVHRRVDGACGLPREIPLRAALSARKLRAAAVENAVRRCG